MAMKKKKLKDKIFSRYNVLYIVLAIMVTAIIMQLYNLQIVKGSDYSSLVNTNTTKQLTQNAARGVITDKNGVILATNVISYQITYIETENSHKQFFTTMQKVLKILDDNKETQSDDFALKINPFRFDFSTDNPDTIKSKQLRFLKDRGFQDAILKKEFNSKAESKLTSSEVQKLNQELLKISAEQVFNQLVKNYKIEEGFKSAGITYSVDTARKYMIMLDTLKMQSYSNYKPITIADNINRNTAVVFWQELNDLPGIDVQTQPLRSYPFGQLGSAVLGYLSKIDSSDEDKYKEKGYDPSSDYIGKTGIEAALENELKGEKGTQVVKVDSFGRIKSQIAAKDAYPGYNVQLTIDSNVQYAADQALDKEMQKLQSMGILNKDAITKNATRSAAIVLNVKTGAILALASRPGFNPNDFANPKGLSTDMINQYFNPDYEAIGKSKGMSQDQIDKMFPIDTSIAGNTTVRKDLYDFLPKPLYNYATMSLIPPGSTFKPLTAVAGLETGVISAYTTVDDEGYFDDGNNFKVSFPSDGANGVVNVSSAIARSSNPFFMTVGKMLRNAHGDDALAKYAWQFGLGCQYGTTVTGTGIEIPENFGQVYNTKSQADISARQYLMNIELYLSQGYDPDHAASFQKLDLYSYVTDSKEVTSIKQEIRDKLKNSVKTGDFAKSKDTYSKYHELIQKLISTDPKYKDKTFSKSDYTNILNVMYNETTAKGYSELRDPFNMYNASIGQGMSQFTPLQLVDYIATLVNGGNRYKLHLVDKITDMNGKVVEENKPTVLNKVDISANTISLVKAGMEGTTGDNGTAAAAFAGFPISTGGKTGSAQFSATMQAEIGRSSYAFYVGYAPADDPQIAVVSVIFDGGYGYESANVVRGIYEAYFKDELTKMNYNFTTDVTAKPEN